MTTTRRDLFRRLAARPVRDPQPAPVSKTAANPKPYAIGVDFGTSSARAIVVCCVDGTTAGSAVSAYHSGDNGVLTHGSDARLARQNPADYIGSLGHAITGALSAAEKAGTGFTRDQVIGIGVATTGSTPLPIDARARPLAIDPQWEGHLAAQAWLWNDHTAADEAAAITSMARAHAPQYLALVGGTYAPEWWWSKIWKCLKAAPDVFDAAASWVEVADFVPAVLAGVDNPKDIVRCVSAAGHKAMYSEEWGGLPSTEFLARLDPKLAALRDRLYERAFAPGMPAGNLCKEWSRALGLREGIVIAMGGLVAHYGAVGAGIEEGTLVRTLGEPTCDCAIVKVDTSHRLPAVPGICGMARGSILPGCYGIEVRPGIPEQRTPGGSDRATTEEAALGTRVLIERLREHGVPIDRVVCRSAGDGIDDLFVQIHANVIGLPISIAGSSQAPALGAALSAAVTAGVFASFQDAQKAMTSWTGNRFVPNRRA